MLIAVVATLALGACSSSRDGYLAVAMDPAGRLLAVVALCDGQQLASLTLTDETSGKSTTARLNVTPEFGGTVILTPPIDNPRPEGALDLLDRGHEYTLSGTVRAADAEADDTSATSQLRFTLDTVVKAKGLRAGSVYAASEDSDAGAEIKKEDFLARARDECG